MNQKQQILFALALNRLHTSLTVAKDIITTALDETPESFPKDQFERLNELRNKLAWETAELWNKAQKAAQSLVQERQSQPLREIADNPDDFPPLADHDSLPDPPVIAGPDDNTPNFIQIDNHGMPPITFFQLDESHGFTKIPNPAMRLTGM
jgi:hypothetical protein